MNRAEAVALCNGVKDNCAPTNCTGSRENERVRLWGEEGSPLSLMGCEDRREKRVLEAEEARWRVFLAEFAATAIFSAQHMVSEPFRAYPNEYLCWAYRATRYRAAIGPPIIYSPTHELLSITLGVRGCVGDPTSTRDESLS